MKTMGKKLCAILLAGLLAAAVLPTSAFAVTGYWFHTGPMEKSSLDKCFNGAVIPAVNDKVKGFAVIEGTVHELDAANSYAVITITNPKTAQQEAVVQIVGNMLEELHKQDNSSAISKIAATSPNPGTCLGPETCIGGNPSTCVSSDGKLTFRALTGDLEADRADLVAFCQCLGIMQTSNNDLSELDNKAFAFTVEPSFGGTSVTYTFGFKVPKLEITEGEAGKVEIDHESKTVSGDDLRDDTSATGKTAQQITEMFKGMTNGVRAEVKVVDQDGQPVSPTAPVGTGCKVQLVTTDGGNVLETIEIIVTGDTSGDGHIDNIDAQKLMNEVAQIAGQRLDGVYATAGHMVPGEDKLSNIDAQAILNLAAVKA